MSVKIFDNVFSIGEINQLIEFYKKLPISNTKYLPNGELRRVMKNSEYNLEDQLPFQIINSKLTNLLGEHCFTGGHWMDSYWPFSLHVDNISSYNDRGVPVFESPLHKNIGVLIPLSEHEHFKTIFFDHKTIEYNVAVLDQISKNSITELDPEFMSLVDHHSLDECKNIKKLKLDCVADWQLGGVFTWDRDQLHCSSNFGKYKLHKQAIVLWL
jgi:hypothetical protein